MPSKAISIGTAQQELIEANARRTALIVICTHAGQTLYIDDDDDVSTTEGIEIGPGANVILEKSLGFPVHKRWMVVADGAATTGIVYEGFKGEVVTAKKLPTPGLI